MKNLEQLLQIYANDKRGKEAVESLIRERPTNIRFTGIVGAQESFVLSGAYLVHPHRMLYVAETKEAAAYLYHNIGNLLPGKPTWFFPDSYRRPGVYDRLDNNQVLQRTETINKITSSPQLAHIVISYPEALVEKVVSPQVLEDNRISLKIGEEVDLDFLVEILIEYGFDHVDFVYEPGQFSLRGGIFDLFSFGNEWPYRIELFDEEIESIRTFNPISQLSLKNISSLAIVPNINRKFEAAEKVSLFKLLPEDTVVVIGGSDQFMLDRLQGCFEACQQLPKAKPDEDVQD
ncbi:MAG: transcription-repair coupling factor, partial [Saprospiraceae bacterium]|nr:transcription-repair coupling factor [Saprospiraceae bacterium]